MVDLELEKNGVHSNYVSLLLGLRSKKTCETGGNMEKVSESAFSILWVLTAVNLGLGAALWLSNTLYLPNVSNGSDLQQSVIFWQSIGSSLLGFGGLSLLIALATSSILFAMQKRQA